jgi:hypothetical protein
MSTKMFQGALMLLLVYAAVKMGPDFARYMKIRSM